MSAVYQMIITNAGREAIASCVARQKHLRIAELAVGDGGGEAVSPKASQTALVREVYRGGIDKVLPLEDKPTYILAEKTIPSDVGGWTAREVGLYSDDGVLVAVGNMPASVKPAVADGTTREMIIRVVLEIGAESVCDIVIDSSILLDTGKYLANVLTREAYDALAEAGALDPTVIYFVKGVRDVADVLGGLEERVAELGENHAADAAAASARMAALESASSALADEANASKEAREELSAEVAAKISAATGEINALKASVNAAEAALGDVPAQIESKAREATVAAVAEEAAQREALAAQLAAESATRESADTALAGQANGLAAKDVSLESQLSEIKATLETFPGMGELWESVTAGLVAETAAREAADTAEATAREAADTAEATARAAADAELAAAIARQESPFVIAPTFVLAEQTTTLGSDTPNNASNVSGWYGYAKNLIPEAEQPTDSEGIVPIGLSLFRRSGAATNGTLALYARILRLNETGDTWTVAWQSTNAIKQNDQTLAGGEVGPWKLQNVDGRGAIPIWENVIVCFSVSTTAAATSYNSVSGQTTSDMRGVFTGAVPTDGTAPGTENYSLKTKLRWAKSEDVMTSAELLAAIRG